MPTLLHPAVFAKSPSQSARKLALKSMGATHKKTLPIVYMDPFLQGPRQFASHRQRGYDYNDPQEVVVAHGLRSRGGEETCLCYVSLCPTLSAAAGHPCSTPGGEMQLCALTHIQTPLNNARQGSLLAPGLQQFVVLGCYQRLSSRASST